MKKLRKVFIPALSLILALIFCASSFAAVLGDLDGDNKITSADARLALRQSVGLEHFSGEKFTAGDVDFDKKITSADARLILRASVGLETLQKMNNDNGSVTAKVNGVDITKVPYTRNGLTIESLSLNDGKLSLKILNETGKAIGSGSNFAYKIYDAAGTVLQSSNISTVALNKGERYSTYFHLPTAAAKVIFGDSKIHDGFTFENQPTMVKNGFTVTKLPYTEQGITVDSVTFNEKSHIVGFVVTNNSGAPISGSSSMKYKCYDANGSTLSSGSVSFKPLNNKEKCLCEISFPAAASKIQIGDFRIDKDVYYVDNANSSIENVKCPKFPISDKGIVCNAVSVTRDNYYHSPDLTYTIKNTTGKTISFANMYFKCYDSAGYVLGTKLFSASDLNAGESYKYMSSLPEGTVKITYMYSYVSFYSNGKTFPKSEVKNYGSLKITGLPYSTAGLTIEKLNEVKNDRAYFTVSNKTGKALDDNAYIEYRMFDSAGNVIRSSDMSVVRCNNGEKCRTSISVPSNCAAIRFGAGNVKEGAPQSKPSVSAVTKEGIKVYCPKSINGITINSIESDKYHYFTINVTNNTGKALSSSSRLWIKMYDTSGVLINNRCFALMSVGKGESFNINFYPETDTASMYLVEAEIK